jgi:glycosyltransferase involved in cell wall biosynthesis
MADSLNGQPLVTVVIPCYNAAAYLREAIDSILRQSYTAFELHLINDGSADDTEKIIMSYKDPRITYTANPSNLGLIRTLNNALQSCNTRYFLRMDADDIAHSERIGKQVRFMESNPHITVCGSQVHYFGSVDSTSALPLDHEHIRATLLFHNCFAHPGVIIRTEDLTSRNMFYSLEHLHAEDYELWTRIAKVSKLANLPEVLLEYRLEGQNITVQNWKGRKERMAKIHSVLLSELEIEPDQQTLDSHFAFSVSGEGDFKIRDLHLHCQKLLRANSKHRIYDDASLRAVMDSIWRRIFYKTADKGLAAILNYYRYKGLPAAKELRYVGALLKTRLKR